MMKVFLKKFRIDILIFIAFATIAIFFLREGIFNQKIVWGHDTPKIIYPFTKLLDSSLKEHKFTLWTPNIYFGFPIGSEQGQYGIFYPPNLLHAFLPLQTALTTLYFIHIFLAAAFTYILCRLLKIGIFGATISAIAFMLNGFIIAHLQYPSHVYAYPYLPLSIILLELGLRQKRNIFFALSGTAIGVGFLTGHPNIPTISLIAAFLYLVIKFVQKETKIQSIFVFLSGVVLISLPYSSQLVTLVPLSIRANGVTFADATNASFSFYDFITFLFPNFFFGNLQSTWAFANNWHFWTYWGQVETAGFLGISTIMLTVLSVLKIKDKKILPFFLILAVALVIALGKNTPIYTLLFKVPVFNGLRAPGKFIYLVDFCLAILAGFGTEVLLSPNFPKKIKLFMLGIVPFVVVLLFTLGNLLGSYPNQVYDFVKNHYSKLGPLYNLESASTFRKVFSYSVAEQTKVGFVTSLLLFVTFMLIVTKPKNRVIQVCAVIILVAEVLIFANGVNPWKKESEIYTKDNPIINQLKGSLGVDNRIYTSSSQWSNFMPNQLLNYQIPEASGFSSLPLKKFEDWQKEVESGLSVNDISLLAQSGVSYTYYPRNGKVLLTTVRNSLTRAFTTHFWQSDGSDEIKLLKPNPASITPAKIITSEPDYTKITSTSQTPELLVLNDTFYPGWKASINGNVAKIYKVNGLFRGVFVPMGKNTIEFKYNPPFLVPSIIISAVWVTILAIWLVKLFL